jgi:hypothetical protein
MRTAKVANYRIDWPAWAAKNRVAQGMDEQPSDPLDTKVTGPWLHCWSE